MNKVFISLLIILLYSCAHNDNESERECPPVLSSKKSLPLESTSTSTAVDYACVLVQFDIDDQGKTNNIKILNAYPKNRGFEQSAKKVVNKWRYVKKSRQNMQVKIEYKLE